MIIILLIRINPRTVQLENNLELYVMLDIAFPVHSVLHWLILTAELRGSSGYWYDTFVVMLLKKHLFFFFHVGAEPFEYNA